MNHSAALTGTETEALPLLSKEELTRIKSYPVPRHVAFIPDGNRRWARKNRILPEEGHQIGAKTLLNVIKSAHLMGIKTLTFYIFSTENWLRPKREIKAQMYLLEKSLLEQKKNMLENGIRFRSIGNLEKFPPHIIALVKETEEATRHCNNITVVFAMNYGGRDDIKRALVKIIDDCDRKIICKEQITEELISSYLDTAEWSDPDLLIRTSGESRVSNFLLWQISYSEIHLSPVFWPEFTPHHFLEAVADFQKRERRLGGS